MYWYAILSSQEKKCNIWYIQQRNEIEQAKQSSLETPRRVIDKQCKPRSDTAEHGVWAGSPLFANSSTVFFKYLNHIWHTKNQS